MTDQNDIIRDLGMALTFDAASEVEKRTAFLANYIRTSGARALVLGISGGVDSLTAGLLAQHCRDGNRRGQVRSGPPPPSVKARQRMIAQYAISVRLQNGFEHTFHSVQDTLDFLENEWPRTAGPHRDRATVLCQAALNRSGSSEAAREAVISACLEANIPQIIRQQQTRHPVLTLPRIA